MIFMRNKSNWCVSSAMPCHGRDYFLLKGRIILAWAERILLTNSIKIFASSASGFSCRGIVIMHTNPL